MLISVVAGAAVKITPLNTKYSTQEVTFKVEWQNSSVPYNNRVWVWVDFCPVTGTIPATSFSTATITNATKTGGNGTITGATTRGFFIEYANATNVGTTVTATLSNAPAGKFNWCAYGSDFPPNAYVSGGSYTLRGSPPFVVNGSTLAASVTHYVGNITSLTDATGAPGIFCMPAGQAPGNYGCCSGLSVNVSTGLCAVPTFCDPSSTVSLDVVSFTPGTEITITGSSYTQVWSRPVTATGCQKITFNGGTSASVKSDCRTNQGYAGAFFSWCAAVKYANQLCPFPWRIPTAEDICRLHKALTGAACVDATNFAWANTYVNQWGIQWNGVVLTDGTMNEIGASAHYLLLSHNATTHDRFLINLATGMFYNSAAAVNNAGRTLRCVRD